MGFGTETGSQKFREKSIHSATVNSLFCVSKYFRVIGVFGKLRLFPASCSEEKLLSNSKSRDDVYLASGYSFRRSIVTFYKIRGNGKGWWILFKIGIFSEASALTGQSLYTN